jgi:rhodanese-related sulfurtransferase
VKEVFLSGIFILALASAVYNDAQAVKQFIGTASDEFQAERVYVAGGSYRNIPSEQLRAMLQKKDFVLINVHIPYEGELPYTDVFIPYNEMEKNLGKLPPYKNAKIVLYCRSDRMSTVAAETLVRLGYTNIWNLNGGMIDWKKKGFPLLDRTKE